MKYMTFNSSCSFAGIANMLERMGYAYEDYQVADIIIVFLPSKGP